MTALYEIVPAGVEVDASTVDPLKYQRTTAPSRAASSGELLTVKVRYKAPDGDTSSLLTRVLMNRPSALTRERGLRFRGRRIRDGASRVTRPWRRQHRRRSRTGSALPRRRWRGLSRRVHRCWRNAQRTWSSRTVCASRAGSSRVDGPCEAEASLYDLRGLRPLRRARASRLPLDVLNDQIPCERVKFVGTPFKTSTPARSAGNQTLP